MEIEYENHFADFNSWSVGTSALLGGAANSRGRGALVFEVGYHLCKKLGLFFQDQAVYVRTLFRGAKTCKIGKKGVFLVIVTNFGKDMTSKLRKTHAKMHIWDLILYLKNMCLGCVLKVLLQGWYPAWNTSAPPPGQITWFHAGLYYFSSNGWQILVLK